MLSRLDAMPQHAKDSDDDDDHSPIYTTRRTRSALELRQAAAMAPSMHLPRATGLSALLGEGLGWRKPKITQITTAPGQLGAGETETEADEPVSSHDLPLSPGFVTGGSKALCPLFSQTIFRLPA